jgi:hypothetical protein
LLSISSRFSSNDLSAEFRALRRQQKNQTAAEECRVSDKNSPRVSIFVGAPRFWSTAAAC